jgi:hypothetical protein
MIARMEGGDMSIQLLFIIVFGGVFVSVIIVVAIVAASRRLTQRVGGLAARAGGGEVRNGVSGTVFQGVHQGVDYACKFHPGSKNSPPSLTVTLQRAAPGKLVVTRESGFDRAAKNLGLAEEVQAGSDDFDRAFYLDTDQTAFYGPYFGNRERREAVAALFAAGYSLARITFSRDGLSAVVTPLREKQLEGFPLPLFLDNLALLALGLPGAETTGPVLDDEEARSASGRRRFALLVAFLVILQLTGIVLLVIGLTAYTPMGASLVWRSLKYSLPAYGFFAWLAWGLCKGRSSSHKRFLGLAVFGLPAFLVGILGVMLFANGRLDLEPGRIYNLPVVYKYVSRDKNSKNYHLVLRHWDPRKERKTLLVDRSFYDRVVEGESVWVTIKPGYFHQEWLQSVRR